MLIKVRKGWELPESAATPEGIFFGRRKLLQGAAAGGLLAAAGLLAGCDDKDSAKKDSAVKTADAAAKDAPEPSDPSVSRYPVKQNPKYLIDRPVTDERVSTRYNNFYEFGTDKSIYLEAQTLRIRPWEVRIDGLVEKPQTIAIDDLIAKMPLEERLYRHRCVEAWSMAVPWSGFALSALVDFAQPKNDAKYLVMQTFMAPDQASGQRESWYPWPYTEGLTMAEARNELAFMVTGVYGKPLPKQMGAPLRLAVPWKYGFKSAKSIVKFSFTDQRPKTYWEALGPSEYGFWANVNPDVPHPRWSQASERVIGIDKRMPTLMYNGYGDFVADLYKNMPGEKLYM